MDLWGFSALEDKRELKPSGSRLWEDSWRSCVWTWIFLFLVFIYFSQDECRNLSTSTDVKLRLDWDPGEWVVPVVLCTWDIIKIFAAIQRCQERPEGLCIDFRFFTPLVIPVLTLLSEDIRLNVFCLGSWHTNFLHSSAVFVFALPLNVFFFFFVLYFSLEHCPTMNINKAGNINSPSVLSSSQAWLK